MVSVNPRWPGTNKSEEYIWSTLQRWGWYAAQHVDHKDKKGGITSNRKMGNDRRPLFPAKLPPIFWGMLCHWQQSKTCLCAAPEKLSHMGMAQYLWDYGTNSGILDPFAMPTSSLTIGWSPPTTKVQAGPPSMRQRALPTVPDPLGERCTAPAPEGPRVYGRPSEGCHHHHPTRSELYTRALWCICSLEVGAWAQWLTHKPRLRHKLCHTFVTMCSTRSLNQNSRRMIYIYYISIYQPLRNAVSVGNPMINPGHGVPWPPCWVIGVGGCTLAG